MASYEEEEGYKEDDEYAADYAENYDESRCQQFALDCCGRCVWLTFAFFLIAWIAHSFSLPKPDQYSTENWDLMPHFAKTLIWRSIAHHTEPWQEWHNSLPPPPPSYS